ALGFSKRPESKKTVDNEAVERLVAERLKARKAKNFKESDRIRDELTAMGVVLKDSNDGTTWEVARGAPRHIPRPRCGRSCPTTPRCCARSSATASRT